MRNLRSGARLLVLAAAYGGMLLAQTTLATVTGLVTDVNGAIVPGAKIEITNTATNIRYTGTSNDAGLYTVTQIQNGPYTFRATATGFAPFVVENLELVERDLRRIDVRLQVGSVQTTVEVSSKVSLIETETARVSDVKEHDVIWIAPLFLHRSVDILNMAPMSTGSTNPEGGGYYGYRLGGSRSHQSEFFFDGISAVGATGGTLNGVMGDRTEAFQEVRVEAAGNNAEFDTVGQVSLVTRAGTNQIHGSAFDMYMTPNWQGRNPFASARTANLQHQPGGTLGGPVYIPKIYNGKNRTFFFAAIEFERFGGAAVTVFNPTVPLTPWRTGDFSQLLPATTIKDPFGGNVPFPNNVIPASRLNPVAMAVQNQFYPQPNYGNTSTLGAGNYRNLQYFPLPTNPTGNLRIDHRFSDKAWVYGRLTRTYWDQNGVPGTLDTYGYQQGLRNDSQYGLSFTYIITPSLVSETHYGYISDNQPHWGPTKGLDEAKQLGLTGLAPNLPNAGGMYAVNWSGLGLTPIGTVGGLFDCSPCNLDPVHLGYESISWFHGRHSVKAGFELHRNDYEYYAVSGNMYGNDTFSNRYTGFAYSDFLLGIPTTAARAYAPIKQSLMERQYAMFVQDQFRVGPRLTLNYGLRWDIKSPWTEANNLLSVFDPKTGKIVVPDAALSHVSQLMPTSYIGVISASQAGYPQSLIHGHHHQLAPRLGVAWRPVGNNFVVRAGIGIYYDNYMDHPAVAGVPFSLAEPAYTNPATNPTVILPQVFPEGGNALSSVAIPAAYDPNLKSPYSIQYTASVERQFRNTAISLSFVSTGSRERLYARDLNQPYVSTTRYVNAARAFPNLPNINYYGSGAGNEYRAGTIEVKHTFSNGLWFQSYYTLARDIGDLDANTPVIAGGTSGLVEDAYNRHRDVGVWSNPPSNRWYSAFIYDLPVGKGKTFLPNVNRWLDLAIGGWQLAGNYVYESGFFLTPYWSGPDPTNTRYTASSTAPTVTLRPNILSNPNLSDPTIQQWFNVGAFSAPSPGAFGTSSIGTVIGPPINALGATVKKYFNIGERVKIRLEFLAINALNHPQWATPNLNISAVGTAGTITGVATNHGDSTAVRQVQTFVRVEW